MIKREYWDLFLLRKQKKQHEKELERVSLFPMDYQESFKRISDYLFSSYGGFDGFELMDAQIILINLMEEAVGEGLTAQQVFGDDLEAFAKNFGQEVDVPNWKDKAIQRRKSRMNRRIARKMKGDKK